MMFGLLNPFLLRISGVLMERVWFPFFDELEFDDLRQFIEVNMLKHLDIRVEALEDDAFIATMPVDHRTQQPMGLLHGGASCVLAESLGSIGSYLCIDPDRYNVVGLEINANHVRSVTGGRVKGVCKPLSLGRSIHLWEIRIYDEAEKLVCVSRMTNAVLDKRE